MKTSWNQFLGRWLKKRKREPDRDEVENFEESIMKITEDLKKMELDRNIKPNVNFKFKLDPTESVEKNDGDMQT